MLAVMTVGVSIEEFFESGLPRPRSPPVSGLAKISAHNSILRRQRNLGPSNSKSVCCWLAAYLRGVFRASISALMSAATPRILNAMEHGDPKTTEQLLPLVYDELHH